MPTTFLDLSRELRDEIYKHALVLPNPIFIRPQEPVSSSYVPTTSLLLVNRTINSEARDILYAENSFDFQACDSKDVITFLERIGPRNASCIPSIIIPFPRYKFDYDNSKPYPLQIQNLTLVEERSIMPSKLQEYCTSVRTITMDVKTANHMECTVESDSVCFHWQRSALLKEALQLVDAHFKALLSLKVIVVELYAIDNFRKRTREVLRSEMGELGWIVREIEPEEEMERERMREDESRGASKGNRDEESISVQHSFGRVVLW